jgi:mRNA-degrading endonuclease RelE of RelBE toxin-antitoxin system
VKRTFKELSAFTKLVKNGKISDELLKDLQSDIMLLGGDTMPRTGGLMKIRLPGSGRGKRGGIRVIYADYPAQNITVLIVAYFKNIKVTLSGEETKILKALKLRLDKQISGD